MAYVLSESQQAFSDAQKMTQLSHSQDDRDHQSEAPQSPITSQLYLKSSQALNKDVVLRRLRHHKCLSKVRSAIQGLVSGSEEDGCLASVHEHKWLDQNDNFSCP